ncbi:hypothetical protein SOVF_210300, partial [Spinacia oleracea]
KNLAVAGGRRAIDGGSARRRGEEMRRLGVFQKWASRRNTGASSSRRRLQSRGGGEKRELGWIWQPRHGGAFGVGGVGEEMQVRRFGKKRSHADEKELNEGCVRIKGRGNEH